MITLAVENVLEKKQVQKLGGSDIISLTMFKGIKEKLKFSAEIW